MSWQVRTTDGTLVYEPPSKNMDEEAAQASAAERNKRAEQMGLSVRYEAVER